MEIMQVICLKFSYFTAQRTGGGLFFQTQSIINCVYIISTRVNQVNNKLKHYKAPDSATYVKTKKFYHQINLIWFNT